MVPSGLVAVLVGLLVFCLVVWVARRLLAAFGIGEPIAGIVYVVLVVVFVLYVLTRWMPLLT